MPLTRASEQPAFGRDEICFLMKDGIEEVICTVSIRVLLAFGETVGTNNRRRSSGATEKRSSARQVRNTIEPLACRTKPWTSANAIYEPWSRPRRGGRGRAGTGLSVGRPDASAASIVPRSCDVRLPSRRSPNI
jgi:hypothetical protein